MRSVSANWEHYNRLFLMLLAGCAPAIAHAQSIAKRHLCADPASCDLGSVLLGAATGVDVNATSDSAKTALMRASGYGRLDVVRWLTTHGADLNAANWDNETPLGYASESGHLDVVEWLAAHGATVNGAKAFDGRQWTQLGFAVMGGHLSVIEWLVAHGANLNGVGGYYLGKLTGPLGLASAKGQLEVVQWLVAHGAIVNDTSSYRGNSVQFAALGGHLDVAKWLVGHGAALDTATTFNDSLCSPGYGQLGLAALGGHLDVVQWLLDRGININRHGLSGPTALAYAAEGQHLNVVQWLVSHGADINAGGRGDDNPPLLLAAYGGSGEVIRWLVSHGASLSRIGVVVLGRMAARGDLDVVQWLADQSRINVDTLEPLGSSPLMDAASGGHLDVIQWLVAHGANVNGPNGHNHTPLDVAAETGHLDAVQWLVAHGANINELGYAGTAVGYAAFSGHLDVVQWLATHGANVNLRAPLGDLPIFSAASTDHLDVVEWLANHGASASALDEHGESLLMHAAATGSSEVPHEVAPWLVAHGADVNARDRTGKTPLMFAVHAGHRDIAAVLLDHGAEISDSVLADAKDSVTADFIRSYRLQQLGRLTTVSPGQDPNSKLNALAAQLASDSTNPILRDAIFVLASTMKPPPIIPEDAHKHMVTAETFLKRATTSRDIANAVAEFQRAVAVAPWYADAYYNLGVAELAAGQYGAAKTALQLYLRTNPSPEDARAAQDKIYEVDAEAKLAKNKSLVTSFDGPPAPQASHANVEQAVSNNEDAVVSGLGGGWTCESGCNSATVTVVGSSFTAHFVFQATLDGCLYDENRACGQSAAGTFAGTIARLGIIGSASLPGGHSNPTNCDFPRSSNSFSGTISRDGKAITLNFEEPNWEGHATRTVQLFRTRVTCTSVTQEGTHTSTIVLTR